MGSKDAALAAVALDGLDLRHFFPLRGDKELVLAAVQHTGMALCYAAKELQEDKEVVLAAVAQHWMALQYASDEMTEDNDVVQLAVSANGLALKEAGPRSRGMLVHVMEAVKNDGRALQYASEDLRKDHLVVMEALKSNPEALEFAHDDVKEVLEVIMPALRRDGAVLRFLPHSMRDSCDVTMDAVQTCGLAVSFATAKVRADREVMMTAARKDGLALAYAVQELLDDEDLVEAACEENALALQYASDRWRSDKDFVKTVLGRDGRALEFVSGGLSDDFELCMEAVNETGEALIHCSAALRDNEDICRMALHNDGLQLLNVSPRLRQDRELALLAVSTHPPVLAHLLEEQIFDQELVSTAVSHDGLVLIFAPETMRDDEVVVQAAVSQNGLALEYASARLRSKCEIVLAALGENPEAVHHVLPIMRDDQEMMAFGQDRRPHLPSQLKSRLRPLALKMALARIRMFLEPLLKKLKVHWEQARPILRKLNSLEDLQLAADDPEAFLKGLDSREDVGMDWKIALLRPSLEPVANERSLWWDEMAPVLRSCSAKELKAASEDGKRFLDSLMSKTRGETARLLCIAQLRRPLSAVLPKGLPWHDVVPALHQVETVKELQTAREAPDLLLWKMNSNSQEWAPALLYQFLRLRPKMEPKLAEVAPGVYWEDFAKSLQALEPLELLQAEKSIYRFLQLLDIYPADPPGRWWFMARLRPHMELQLETQGNTWEEAVEMMSEMDAAFDLKPAIHGPAAFCLRLAEGPARLAFGAFGADGANRTLRPEDLQGLQIRVSTADSFEGAAAATESP